MIFTTSWLNFFPAFIAGEGGETTVSTACGTSSAATTSGMTSLVSQVATAINLVVGNVNNRLTVTATYGSGSAYTAVEHGLWINSPGYSSAFARWVASPLAKAQDEYYNVDYGVDFSEVV